VERPGVRAAPQSGPRGGVRASAEPLRGVYLPGPREPMAQGGNAQAGTVFLGRRNDNSCLDKDFSAKFFEIVLDGGCKSEFFPN